MLSIALIATVVGFGLLVVALVTGKLALAIACVAVCAVGLILLLIDTLRAGRRGRAGVGEDPLFTIRGRGAGTAADREADDGGAADAEHTSADGDADGEQSPTPAYDERSAASWSLADEPVTGGLGSLVAPADEQVHAEPATDASGGFAPLSGGFSEEQSGDVTDYLRATGSFPAQQQPSSRPIPQQAPSRPETPHPEMPGPQEQGRRSNRPPAMPQRSELVSQPAAQQSAAQQSAGPSEPPRSEPLPSEPSSSEHMPPATAEPYVGRRRLAGDPTDDIIVRAANPELPAMKFVWDDPDEAGRHERPDDVQ